MCTRIGVKRSKEREKRVVEIRAVLPSSLNHSPPRFFSRHKRKICFLKLSISNFSVILGSQMHVKFL